MSGGLAFKEKELTFPCWACFECTQWQRDQDAIARAVQNGAGGEILGAGDGPKCLREAEFLAQEQRRQRRAERGG